MPDPLIAIFVAGVLLGIALTTQAYRARYFVFLVRCLMRHLRHGLVMLRRSLELSPAIAVHYRDAVL